MKIAYREQFSNGLGGTVCEYMYKENTIMNIQVGSFSCSECQYFKGNDTKNKTVCCSFEDGDISALGNTSLTTLTEEEIEEILK